MACISITSNFFGGDHPTMIRAILLDLFGTTVAYGDVVQGTRLAWEGVYGVLCGLGANVPYDEFAAEWQAQLITPLAPGEDMAETPFLSKILRFFGGYGLPQDLGAVTRAAENCLSGWDTHLYLPEDTLPTLVALRKNYALALVSNFDHPPYVRGLLAHYGLADFFNAIVISGEIGVDKPDPRIFHRALDAVRCSPEEALFVGDSLESDITGARSVGCRPVLIDMKDSHPQYAGERIRSLEELLPLLGH